MASAPGTAARFLPLPRRAGLEEWAALALAIACLGYALHIAIAYAGQPPLDLHRFRQTQTALTAYWLGSGLLGEIERMDNDSDVLRFLNLNSA